MREVRSDRLDVADRDAFGRYALDVVQHFGRVNVVINNAGVALAGDFADLEYADIDWIIGVNFWGVVHGTKEFLPHLIASGDGHVVNLSSLFGLVSMPGQSMYNADEVRRARHDRGAPRGDAHRRSPGRRHRRAPRRHQDRDRPQRPGLRQGEQGGDRRPLRREAGPDDAGAGRRDHRQRHPQEPAPGCSSASTPTPCTTWPSCSARATRTSSPGPPSACCRRRPTVV